MLLLAEAGRPLAYGEHPLDLAFFDNCARQFTPDPSSSTYRVSSLIPPYNQPHNNKTEEDTKTEENCPEPPLDLAFVVDGGRATGC
jgi:hypothetical protein